LTDIVSLVLIRLYYILVLFSLPNTEAKTPKCEIGLYIFVILKPKLIRHRHSMLFSKIYVLYKIKNVQ